MADPVTLLPFRVHFDDPDQAPLDLLAEDADHARDMAKKRRGAILIRKIKRIRENGDV